MGVCSEAIKEINQRVFSPIRRRDVVDNLVSFFKKGTVLDCGSSDGRVASQLKALNPKLKIFGVDVHILDTKIPTVKYNGLILPFKNNSLNYVMLVDVLHHTKDPEKVLCEAKRVTKKYIVIKDHYYENDVDWWILKVCDWVANKPFGIKLPYNFKKLEEWNKLFSKLKLSLKKARFWNFYAAKHFIAKLEK